MGSIYLGFLLDAPLPVDLCCVFDRGEDADATDGVAIARSIVARLSADRDRKIGRMKRIAWNCNAPSKRRSIPQRVLSKEVEPWSRWRQQLTDGNAAFFAGDFLFSADRHRRSFADTIDPVYCRTAMLGCSLPKSVV